jgi:cell division protein FtsZ
MSRRRVLHAEDFEARLDADDVELIEHSLGMKLFGLTRGRASVLGTVLIAEGEGGATTLRLKRRAPDRYQLEISTDQTRVPRRRVETMWERSRALIDRLRRPPVAARMLASAQHLKHPYLAVIKVVGIGGGGCNAVNRMIDAGVKGVEFIAINTDAQSLLFSDADVKIDIGRQLTRGLGAGSDPELGRQAAEGHRQEIEDALKGSDMVFIAAGKGGGTGTGGAPVVAEIAKQIGALTIGVVTRPFTFEGHRRSVQAETGIQKLTETVDTIIIVPNERLLQVSDEHISMLNAFTMADEVLLQGVRGVTDLITTPGLINTDLADVKMILTNAGSALMGIGYGSGDGRAITAARSAISSPLLEASIEGARGILLNVSGPSDLGLFELNEAAEIISQVAHPDANIIFGAVIGDSRADEVCITVIAAGFERVAGESPTTSTKRASRNVENGIDSDDEDLDVPEFLR